MSRPAVATARRNGRSLVLAEIARGSRLDRTYLLLAALSAGLAHLGLLMDSAPVIIGAMLISPLMGPIMGLGFGLAVFESKLLRRALGTLVVGMLLAVAVPLAFTLNTIVSQSRVRATINADLQRLAGPEARISSLDLDPAAQPARLSRRGSIR